MSKYEITNAALPEVMAYLHAAETQAAMNANDLMKFRKNFEGFISFDEMQNAFKTDIQLKGQSHDFEMTNNLVQDIAGFYPLVPDYLAGRPDCMLNFETDTKVNYYDLPLYISLPYDVAANEIKRNGEQLKQYISNFAKPSDRFRITVTNRAENLHELGDESNKFGHIEMKIQLTDFNDYITPEIWNMICSPALYRYYVMRGRSMKYQDKLKRPCNSLNGTPIRHFELPQADRSKYIDFMNMQTSIEAYMQANY